MPTIHAHAHTLAERTVATRRDLHQHPEIAFEEVRTAGIVAERLATLGLAPRTGVGATGVVAIWDTGPRADGAGAGRHGWPAGTRGERHSSPITS